MQACLSPKIKDTMVLTVIGLEQVALCWYVLDDGTSGTEHEEQVSDIALHSDDAHNCGILLGETCLRRGFSS